MVEVNECSVDEVEARQKGLWIRVEQCELRKGLRIGAYKCQMAETF